MGMIHSAVLAALGAWLLFYRLLMKSQFRPIAERLTTMACGLSLAMLSSLLPFPPQGFRAISLGVVGVLLSCCHPALTALIVSTSLAIGVGGFVWQLGLCSVAPDAALAEVGMSTHPLLLTLLVLVFIVLFVCVPGVAGPASLVFALVPSLGALLLTVGCAELMPSAGGLLSASALLSESPCVGVASSWAAWLATPAARSLAVWLLLTTCGVSLQCYLSRLQRIQAEQEADKKTGPGGDLVASLLPGSTQEEGGGANLPRPSDKDDRYSLISKAIFLDESADLSHLTENERKIVKICREDEFERDRLLWGGGLI